MNIQRIRREDIVKEKWNGCVHYAGNGNVFGYTWYLDAIAKDWEALVEDDYVSVFPLVYRKGTFNRLELFQPPLIRSLGIYSVKVLSAVRIEAFLDAIPDEYQALDIRLNSRNRPPQASELQSTVLENHLLQLNQSYGAIESAYKKDFKEALKKAEDTGLLPISGIKPEKIADFFQQYGPALRNKEAYFHGLQRIMYNALHRGSGFATGINHPDTEALLAVNFYLYSHSRMISLVPVESPEGQSLGAMAYLKDMIVRTNAGRPLLLDFNTSGPSPLARNMGAQPERFYRIHRKKKWFEIF